MKSLSNQDRERIAKTYANFEDFHRACAAEIFETPYALVTEEQRGFAEMKNFYMGEDEEQDFHRATAAKMFEVPYAQVTEEQRLTAKKVNFFQLYGRKD